ncbi:MAG TPA: amino acid adenylation domain-containing protein, partial [Anaerolineae bacterium]|nr:amino acid adenylation domain-containing protein [Anaerolineae bacterium]
IGRPIRNVQVYLLDRHRQPVPVGVPGELYIGGAGVARGYLNRPELTAERFVEVPGRPPTGRPPTGGDRRTAGADNLSPPRGGTVGGRPLGGRGRLYRTGDLARYLPDGTIEYLGRLDEQVKVRGFRIELGEIEAVLRQHEGLSAAAVLARAGQDGDRQLVAYVVPRAGAAPPAAELQSFLRQRLPAYMVPAAFVALKALPLTPNGKVDRRALPAPEGQAPAAAAAAGPRTPTEEVLAALWAQVLGVERVGVDDDFFALGGHSLLAMQLAARARDALHLDVPLRALFEHPTVAGLAEHIDGTRHAGLGTSPLTIEPVARDGELALSFAQQRLWFLDQLEPGLPVYNIPQGVRMRGALDEGVLQRCLDEIARRHEVLRTSFPTVDGRPRLHIEPLASIPLAVADLTRLPQGRREAELERLSAEEAQRPFDLARGPLTRATLLRLGPEDHAFLLTMHHMVSDGWSMGVLLRELGALYPAFCAGEPSPLAEPAIQYADFAHWQRAWLQGEALERQLTYWKRQLAGLPPLLKLPTDRPRAASSGWRGATETITLAPELLAQVKALSRREGATLFMTLLAAFQALLYRYTGQEDVCVGTPIANRPRPELEGLIGFFVNTLVLRADFSGEPSFADVLRRVREAALGAYAHQDLPFEQQVEALQPERDLGHTPLFQVMFALQNVPLQALRLPGLMLEPLEREVGIAMFDLSLTMAEGPDGLNAALEYSTDLFDRTTILRMGRHLEALLQGLVADPGQPISRVPLTTEAERRQVLVQWNDTAAEYPRHACLHELYAAQAARTPDAVALVLPATDEPAAARQTSTYAELERRANQLAHLLQARGVAPEGLVGLFCERSPEMVVALLGILKAGGAYVPLDAAYSDERLAYVLEDAQLPLVLTQRSLQPRLPSGRAEAICIDEAWEAMARGPAEAPASGVRPENLAYVIYTSGSTGRPKGVAVPHGAVVNHNLALARQLGLSPADRILQFSTISFDAAIEELFPALLSGARVVLRPEGLLASGRELEALIDREGLTILDLPTAYWHQWVAGWPPDRPPLPASLRLVCVGGEEALAERYARWREVAGDRVSWLNSYGPTEATIVATVYKACGDEAGEVPIGRPIANVQAYVLDRHQQPVPVGLPGELYIGGAGVARGYLNRPELTDERFVEAPGLPPTGGDGLSAPAVLPSPPVGGTVGGGSPVGGRPGAGGGRFPNRPYRPEGAEDDHLSPPVGGTVGGSPAGGRGRLYRTGDLARYRPDGNLEFLGRCDRQVKVRGYRIELEEVEGALRQHPALREVAVVAREDTPGDRRLAAYVVPKGETAPQAGELRAFLQNTLPGYMVPSAFVTLAALPTLPSGKLDRHALPRPGPAEAGVAVAYEAPRTPAEQALAGIWAQVLGVPRVGIHDDFFALGGESILSIQVVARANQAGLPITPRQLFQHPTVAGLAQAAAARPAQAEQGLVTGPVLLAPIQRWFFEQHAHEPHHWNTSMLMEVWQRLDPDVLRRALQALMAHHDALRLRFERASTGWRAACLGAGEAAPLECVDLTGVPEERQGEAVEAVAAALQARFDLTQGPLLRAAYFDLGPEQPPRLFLLFHHLVTDGVSWRIFVDDLQTAYRQLAAGEPLRLPPKTTSYQEWTQRLHGYAQRAGLRAELDYWRQIGARGIAPLPVDRHDGADTYGSVRAVTTALDAEGTQALLQRLPAAGVHADDALLAALARTFAHWTGRPALLVEMEGHGREDLFDDVDLTRTIGWFTTSYPLLLDLEGCSEPLQALRAVQAQHRALPRAGIGYGLLRYLCDEDAVRSCLAALPSPQVSLNYLGRFDQVPAEGWFPFRIADESSGPEQSPSALRTNLFDIVAIVTGEELQLRWLYGENRHTAATVEALAARLMDELRLLVDRRLAAEERSI